MVSPLSFPYSLTFKVFFVPNASGVWNGHASVKFSTYKKRERLIEIDRGTLIIITNIICKISLLYQIITILGGGLKEIIQYYQQLYLVCKSNFFLIATQRQTTLSTLLFNLQLWEEEMDSCIFQGHLCESEYIILGWNLNTVCQFQLICTIIIILSTCLLVNITNIQIIIFCRLYLMNFFLCLSFFCYCDTKRHINKLRKIVKML